MRGGENPACLDAQGQAAQGKMAQHQSHSCQRGEDQCQHRDLPRDRRAEAVQPLIDQCSQHRHPPRNAQKSRYAEIADSRGKGQQCTRQRRWIGER